MDYTLDIIGGVVTFFLLPIIVLGISSGAHIGIVTVAILIVSAAWLVWTGVRVFKRLNSLRDR